MQKNINEPEKMKTSEKCQKGSFFKSWGEFSNLFLDFITKRCKIFLEFKVILSAKRIFKI